MSNDPSANCPLCGAGARHQSKRATSVNGGRLGQHVRRCDACEVCYLSPFLSVAEKMKFYAEDYPEFMASRSTTSMGWLDAKAHVEENEPQRRRRMAYIDKYLPSPPAKILEIGCATGFMLLPLAAQGYECTGVEPAEVFRTQLEANGVECHESLDKLVSGDHRRKFDLILHFFVADHADDIEDFLREQIDLLAPGGRIIFELNSTDDALLSLYRSEPFNDFFWTVAQNYYFSQNSLEMLLSSFSIDHEILTDQRYDLSNHMTWALDSRPGGMQRFSQALGEDTETAYRQALIRSGHCDTVIGVLTNGS